MSFDFDLIVVGARGAGAPTAVLLARQGYRVLAADRATFPSDTLFTLGIQQAMDDFVSIDAGTFSPEENFDPASPGVARMAR